MPGYSFTTIEPNQIGQVTKWDVPINDWLGLKFGAGQTDTLGHQFRNRVEDDIYDDKTEASVALLNRVWGIDDRLKFTEPMSAQRAALIHDRKRKEIESQSYFESASHSWFSGKAAAGFGAAMVGSLSHPLDLGLSFLPFVGSEKAVAGVAKMGGGQLERMMARGLITEERLAAIGVPLPRLSGAMIDGAVNQLAMEVPIAFQKNRDMANYDSSDFAFNVLAGGAFAGGVKSIGLAFERAAKAWLQLDPKIKDAAPLKALREIFTSEPAGFDADVKLDEATIRAQVTERVRGENPFDEAAVRAGYEGPKADIGSGEPIIRFESNAASLNRQNLLNEIPRTVAGDKPLVLLGYPAERKLKDAGLGTIRFRPPESKVDLVIGFRLENRNKAEQLVAAYERGDVGAIESLLGYKTYRVGEIFEDAGLTYRVSSVKDGQVVAIQTGSERFSQMYSPELEVIAQKEARGIDLSPEERATVEGLIDPETPNAHSDYQQRVAQLEDELEIPKLMDEQRRLNLEEYVAQKRTEYDARVKDVADAETKKATENIRKQAKSPLTPEEIQKYTVKAPADDAAIKLVEDEADELIKSVLDSVDSVEDRARLEAEINAELERHGFKTEKKGKEGGTAAPEKGFSWESVEGGTDDVLLTASEVSNRINSFKQAYPNTPEIINVKSSDQLPAEVLASKPANGRSPGGVVVTYEGGKRVIYIVSDNITSIGRLDAVLAHEAIGHYGIESVMGDAFVKLALDVEAKLRGTKEWGSVADAYKRGEVPVPEDALTFGKELLARATEGRIPDLSITERIIAYVREWWRKHVDAKNPISDAEIRKALVAARDFAKKVEQGGTVGIPKGALFQGVRSGNMDAAQGKSGWLTDDMEMATTFSGRTGESGAGRIDVYDPKDLPPLEQMLEAEKSKPGSNVYSYTDLQKVQPVGVIEGGVYKPTTPAAVKLPEVGVSAEKAAPSAGSHESGQRPSGFNPPPEPKNINSLEEALAYREAYELAEMEFYKSLGLSDKEAVKMFLSGDNRSNLDVSSIEAKLSDENAARLEAFSTGEGSQMYQWDRAYDPTELTGVPDKSELARAVVLNLQRESLPNEFGDKMLHAVIALRQLKEAGGTWMDVARELDSFSTRNSSSSGDKLEFFTGIGKKIKSFAQAQGIDLPMESKFLTKPPEVGVSAEKAIDAMIPCVTAKAKL